MTSSARLHLRNSLATLGNDNVIGANRTGANEAESQVTYPGSLEILALHMHENGRICQFFYSTIFFFFPFLSLFCIYLLLTFVVRFLELMILVVIFLV